MQVGMVIEVRDLQPLNPFFLMESTFLKSILVGITTSLSFLDFNLIAPFILILNLLIIAPLRF